MKVKSPVMRDFHHSKGNPRVCNRPPKDPTEIADY